MLNVNMIKRCLKSRLRTLKKSFNNSHSCWVGETVDERKGRINEIKNTLDILKACGKCYNADLTL